MLNGKSLLGKGSILADLVSIPLGGVWMYASASKHGWIEGIDMEEYEISLIT